MSGDKEVYLGASKAIWSGLIAFIVGGAVWLLGLLTRPRDALYAYLSAYAFALSITLGALIFLMISHAMNARWPVAIRRIVEAIVSTIPFMALLFLPIAFGAKIIYPWASSNSDLDPHSVEQFAHQRPYLEISSFLIRAIVYFAIWMGISGLLRRWSFEQETLPNPQNSTRSRILSAAGLFPVALALTFASFDWLMSLSPTWFSTMFGVYVFAGGFLASLSLIVVLVALFQRAGSLRRITRAHYYALGRLMLAFTIFWAYAAYFQLFLIWIANKPSEVTFYALRSTRDWFPFSVTLAIVHFVLPFLFLLPYRTKQSASTLAPVALWLIFAHWLDMEWLIMPLVRPLGPNLHWLDFAAWIGIAGAVLAYGAFRLRNHSLLPKNDPQLDAAFRYESR
jgi:hypothetical protein